MKNEIFTATAVGLLGLCLAAPAFAAGGCDGLPNHGALKAALAAAVAAEKSGLDNQMWATLVDRDGVVCAVAFSGTNRAAQWPGSRLISAQKANTANAFSLDASSSSSGSGQPKGLALSTANLYSAVQPGGTFTACSRAIRSTLTSRIAAIRPCSAWGQTRWWAAASAA